MRILLGIGVLLALFVVFTQLDPAVVRKLGPTAESAYDLFNAPADRDLTLRGQHMVDELKTRGGYANVIERTPGLIGTHRPQGAILDRVPRTCIRPGR